MSIRPIHAQEDEIDSLYSRIDGIEELEMRSEWTKYLCVRTSGYVERSVSFILVKYTEGRSDNKVSNYVESRLNRFTNPKFGKVRSLFGKFSQSWKRQLEKRVEDSTREALGSVVANRHQIVHGGSPNISYVRLKSWYEECKRFITLIYDICDP